MKIEFNFSQRKALSSFFNNIAVAWFIGAFVTPQIVTSLDPLTLLRYLANMVLALYISLLCLKE